MHMFYRLHGVDSLSLLYIHSMILQFQDTPIDTHTHTHTYLSLEGFIRLNASHYSQGIIHR